MRKTLTALLFLLALGPSLFVLSLSLDVPMMGLFGDDTIYYSSAQSLAAGEGYRLPSLEGKPFQTKYPPLFPLLLSLAWKWNPNYPANLPAAAILAWAAVPVYLFLAWRVFIDLGLGARTGLALVFVLAMNGQVLLFGSMLMSEMWFSSAVLAAVWLASRPVDPRRRWPLLAGCAAGLAFLIKSSALPFAVTLPLGYLLRPSQQRDLRAAVTSAFPVWTAAIGWNLWARTHAVQSTDISLLYNTSYLGYYLQGLDLQTFLHMAAANFRLLYSGIPRMLVIDPSSGSWLEIVLTNFILIAGVTGVTLLVRRRVGSGGLHYPLFVLVYLVQLVVWNFMPTARLLLPVLPLLLAGMASSIAAAFRALHSEDSAASPKPLLGLATLALFGPLFIFLAIVSYGLLFHNLPAATRDNRSAMEAKREAYRWIVQHTPPDAGILANDDQLLYLHTGRRSASQIIPALLYYRDSEQALLDELRKLPAYAREHRLDYVMVTSTDLRRENLERFRPELDRIMSAAAPDYEKVFDTPAVRIYGHRSRR